MQISPADRVALALRCEHSVIPDRKLDVEIAVAMLGFWIERPAAPGFARVYCYEGEDGTIIRHHGDGIIPHLTSSLSDCAPLIKDGWLWALGTDGLDPERYRATMTPPGLETVESVADLPTLAICGAALRAAALG